jgi:MoaA/NifB/PqqE/SkfB family radical SAM enzyme
MTIGRFRALLDELPGTRSVILQGLGEPLLAPDLLPMVAEAADRGIEVGFNTNGTLLTRSRAEALVRAGLGWLYVSLDGATATTYEAIRRGASFARVVANVRGLVDARRRSGASRPEVRLVFVAMRRNVHELPALVRLAADLGVDEVSVQNLSHSFDDVGDDPAYEGIRTYAEREALWASDDAPVGAMWAEAAAEAERLGLPLHLPKVEPRHAPAAGEPGCDWPWTGTYVLHDGRVQPCCMVMGDDRAVLGAVGDSGFTEVWHGPAYREFRRRLLDGPPPDVCVGCAYHRGTF